MILANKKIVITRPVGQNQPLVEKLKFYGAEIIVFPTVNIVPVVNFVQHDQVIAQLDKYHILIFISANAVRFATSLIRQYWPILPNDLLVISIGQGTRAALIDSGWTHIIMPPKHFSTEGLLRLPQLQQINEKKIIILAGEGGSTLLEERLIARKAEVIKLPFYKRCCPEIDPIPIINRFREDNMDIIVVTSGDGLHNLLSLLGREGFAYIKILPLLVVSQRLAVLARALGHEGELMVADNATDDAIVASILQRYEG